MLLESKVDGKVLLVDCEASGGINKGDVEGDFDPNRVMASTVELVRLVAGSLAPIIVAPGVGDAEICFGVKVNTAGIVYIATAPQAGQIQVTLKLRKL